MNATADFLREGAKDYIDASAAIEAFEKEVCRVCKRVYETHKPELMSTMGFKDGDCEDYDDNKDPADRWAELGVKKRAKNGCTFYLYISWEETEGIEQKISACVSLDFLNSRDRDDVFKELRRNPACSIERGDDGPYVWLRKKLIDLSSCAETLDQLVKEWLACWPTGRRLE